MMSSRTSEFHARKDLILAITIEQYIKSVTPVSSALISNEYPLSVSSATIRNILAELEEEGYLTHPHTSAGRIPTQRGYRYYVDNLMNQIQLLEGEKRRIKAEYEQQSMELEGLLEKTSQVISEETHYTSIISVDGWGSKIYCSGTSSVVEYPETQDIEKIRNILKTLDEKEKLLELINCELRKKVSIFIGQELRLQQMNSCSLIITSYKMKKGLSGRMAVLGPTRMNYSKVVSTLQYFTDLMEDFV